MKRRTRIAVIVTVLGLGLVTSGCRDEAPTAISELKPADLYGFPSAAAVQPPDTGLTAEVLLREIAADTWQFFEAAVECQSNLPIDYLWIDPDRVGANTSITNIGLYLLAVLTAWDLNLIDRGQTVELLQRTLATVDKLTTYRGFHYNWYNLETLEPAVKFISTVDAGWFYSALSIVELVFPDEFGPLCRRLLAAVDFDWLYDAETGHFRHGFQVDTEEFSPYHYSMLASEARIVSYLALARGEVPISHWKALYSTLPDSFEQQQVPEYVQGIGYYRYKDLLIIPAWGGSLFEYLMPNLLMDERAQAPYGLGENNRRAIEVHIDYALNEMGYTAWGMSPSTAPEGNYGEFGVPLIGSRIACYSPTIVSPHAALLAINYMPEAVISNIKRLLASYPIYGEFGFYDCVDPISGAVGRAYLTLDQAMIFLSLGNYLTDQVLPGRFRSLRGMDLVSDLVSKDNFFPKRNSPLKN
ncbi:MAG: DUF3131 domain-containing protein [Candidatus Marinimicrobia bacterium]|nr:DUF3131 domain-containing protein [Candidatus Neomarinimicrobiota bacterium]